MSRRRGALSPTHLDRCYPFQIMLAYIAAHAVNVVEYKHAFDRVTADTAITLPRPSLSTCVNGLL